MSNPQFSKSTVWRHRPFLLLWAAFFISTASNVAFLITLSISIFVATGSALAAASIFLCRWILPIFLAGATSRVLRRFSSSVVISGAGLASAAIVLLSDRLSSISTTAVLGLLLIRGAVEIAAKTANTVSLKHLIEPALLPSAASIFNTSSYIGGALGALIAAPALNQLGFHHMMSACALLFGVSGVAAHFLPSPLTFVHKPNADQDPKSPWVVIWRMRGRSNGVLSPLLMLFVVVACFQAYHDAVRTILPLQFLNAGSFGVGLLQGLTFLSLLSSALFYAHFSSEGRFLSHANDFLLMGLTCLFMGLAVVWHEIWISLFFYAAFIFFFEFTYLQATKKVLLRCDKSEIVAVSSAQWSIMSAAMVIGTLLNGMLIDKVGLRATTAIGIVIVGVWAAGAYFSKASFFNVFRSPSS